MADPPKARPKPELAPAIPPVAPPTVARPEPVSPPAPEPAPTTSPVVYPPSQSRPKTESSIGYYNRRIHGFNVTISRHAYDESDAVDGRPIGYVEQELGRLADLFPPKALERLRRVPVWVEWDHIPPGMPNVLAVYYGPLGESLFTEGVDPRKSKAVCFTSLKASYKAHAQGRTRQLVLLHEFGHATHDRVLGLDNTLIRNAFEQATTRRLYQNLRLPNGKVGAGYAATNEAEYFAELTCLYFDRLDYEPHDRAGLRNYDSVGYELMTRVWGTPEEIARWKAESPGR